MSDFEGNIEPNNPRPSDAAIEALGLLDYVKEETEKIVDAINGIGVLAESSEYTGLRKLGEAALSTIAEVAQKNVLLLSPEPQPTFIQRTKRLGRSIVAKYVH